MRRQMREDGKDAGDKNKKDDKDEKGDKNKKDSKEDKVEQDWFELAGYHQESVLTIQNA